jgi:hypothetical protein
MHSLSKMSRKVNTGRPITGAYCGIKLVLRRLFAPARARYLRQKTPTNPQILERTLDNTDMQSAPPPPGFTSHEMDMKLLILLSVLTFV